MLAALVAAGDDAPTRREERQELNGLRFVLYNERNDGSVTRDGTRESKDKKRIRRPRERQEKPQMQDNATQIRERTALYDRERG